MRLMAYIGVGSNLDNPVAQVKDAIEELEAIPDSIPIARSSLYSSKPMSVADQPDYVNAVVAIDTVLSPQALLQVLQAIERRQGRARTGEKWGPRILDLDLLLYGSRIIDTADLTVPHPGMHKRDFVLVPLGEIAGDINIPGRGRLNALISGCENHALRKLVAV